MRFNCQSCGAKYQIADEKVAGKTVRMKCRKCETLIQVRARHGPDGAIEADHVTGPPSVRPGSMPVPGRASRPPGPPPPSSRGGAPPPRASSLPRPSRPSSPGLPAPRPSRPEAPPRPAAPKPGASTLAASKLGPSKLGAAKPAEAPSKPAAPKPPVGEGTAIMADPRLEKAQAKPSEPDDDAVWYVGIEGEPVGPVGQAYLRMQIEAGKVKPGSLVWREGLTDWKPLNTFAELRPLLSAKPAAAPPPPQVSAPVALTRKASGAGTATAMMTEGDQAQAAADSAATSSSAAPSAEPESDEKPAAVSPPEAEPNDPPAPVAAVTPEPKPEKPAPAPAPEPPAEDSRPGAALAASGGSLGAAASAGGGPATAPEPPPSAPDETAAAAAGVAVAEPSILEPAGVPGSKKQVHPMAWAFVAMAAAFGAVSAWFLFGKSESPQPTAMNAGSAVVPAPGEPDAIPSGGDAASERAEGEEPVDGDDEADDADGATHARAVPGRKGQTGSGNPVSPASDGGTEEPDEGANEGSKKADKPCNPDDPFCSPGNVDGPSSGPSSGQGDDGGAGLSQAEAASTVSRYRGSLMRRCRSLVTKGSAKVAATITVGPSGAVQSASVSGGKGFPGLAGCVQSRIMNWRFPSSGGTSTISVSFNFL